MPTTYTDQFYVIDVGSPPAVGTAVSPVTFTYTDVNDDGIIDVASGDTVNGGDVTSVWVNDTITVNVPGQGDVTITGVTFYINGQPAAFTPLDGTILQDATFVSGTYVTTSTQVDVVALLPVCFTAGTLIETPFGRMPIQCLRPGDLVTTVDNGAKPLLKTSRQKYRAKDRFAPVHIAAGALGNSEDLIVSQMHRIQIEGWQAQLLCGAHSVLVAAKHLVNGNTIRVVEGEEVEYFHLLFDQHELVIGSGIASESYFPQLAARRGDLDTGNELLEIFPELKSIVGSTPKLARPEVRRHEAALLTM